MSQDNALPAVVNVYKGKDGKPVPDLMEALKASLRQPTDPADSRAVGTSADTSAALDLDAIDALVKVTTPGPWGYDRSGVWHKKSLGPIIDQNSFTKGDVVGIGEVGDPYPRGDNHPTQNMAFIAAARSLVPQLVAEVRALREDAARYRWLRERYFGADFAYEFQPCDLSCAILFRVDGLLQVGASLDATIDANAARRGAA